jgi:RNA processing factor Prp31
LAKKVALTSRIDAAGQFPDGSDGERIRQQMAKRLERKMNNLARYHHGRATDASHALHRFE